MRNRIAFGILVSIILTGLWLTKGKDTEEIAITAFYMQYACGDDNIDIKVRNVDNSQYNFIIDSDIAPVTNFLTQENLIDFVSSKTLMWQKGKSGDYLENFTLIGHLKSSTINTDCSSPKAFVVNKIKYGNEKEFLEF